MSSTDWAEQEDHSSTFSPTGRGGFIIYCACGADLTVRGDYQAAYAVWVEHVRAAEEEEVKGEQDAAPAPGQEDAEG